VPTLRVELDGAVLRVALSRPDRRNALDASLIAELTAAFTEVGDARAVVLSGDGPSFCAGADAEWMRSAIGLSDADNLADYERVRAMFEAVDGCPAPVVARVHGHALGGGAGLVACADAAIAAPDTVLGFTEVKLGLVPAVISPFVLARIGSGEARRWFVTGERFDAATALRIGLVHDVANDLDGAVERVVDEILASGPAATRAAKALARGDPRGEATSRIGARTRAGSEAQEGLTAFLARRPPAWRAR
jgi:methylglutaconyl-CoA hydratase